MTIRTLTALDFDEVAWLAQIAEAEGYRFLGRLIADFRNGLIQLDQPHEFFLCAIVGSKIIGIGGMTPDPYTRETGVGRIRHVYVHPQHRGKSIGKALVRALEARARTTYSKFTLRTDTTAASQFYESLGYRPARSATTTHERPSPPDA